MRPPSRRIVRGLLVLCLALGALLTAEAATAPRATAQVINHTDGVILSWSPCWDRPGTSWCYNFRVHMYINHDTYGVDEWQPGYSIECFRHGYGRSEPVLCNFALNGFQAHGFSKGTKGTMTTWGTSNPGNENCVYETALTGQWRPRHETFRWVMGQLDYIKANFLDSNCNALHPTNVYHAGTFRVNIWAYDLLYESETSDPIRTGLFYKAPG